jgi:hypothetical protein
MSKFYLHEIVKINKLVCQLTSEESRALHTFYLIHYDAFIYEDEVGSYIYLDDFYDNFPVL